MPTTNNRLIYRTSRTFAVAESNVDVKCSTYTPLATGCPASLVPSHVPLMSFGAVSCEDQYKVFTLSPAELYTLRKHSPGSDRCTLTSTVSPVPGSNLLRDTKKPVPGVGVKLGVPVQVAVIGGVKVLVGVRLRVGVLEGVKVRVRVPVTVGVQVLVGVYVGVKVLVYVKVQVGVGVRVNVQVEVNVRVKV